MKYINCLTDSNGYIVATGKDLYKKGHELTLSNPNTLLTEWNEHGLPTRVFWLGVTTGIKTCDRFYNPNFCRHFNRHIGKPYYHKKTGNHWIPEKKSGADAPGEEQ